MNVNRNYKILTLALAFIFGKSVMAVSIYNNGSVGEMRTARYGQTVNMGSGPTTYGEMNVTVDREGCRLIYDVDGILMSKVCPADSKRQHQETASQRTTQHNGNRGGVGDIDDDRDISVRGSQVQKLRASGPDSVVNMNTSMHRDGTTDTSSRCYINGRPVSCSAPQFNYTKPDSSIFYYENVNGAR